MIVIFNHVILRVCKRLFTDVTDLRVGDGDNIRCSEVHRLGCCSGVEVGDLSRLVKNSLDKDFCCVTSKVADGSSVISVRIYDIVREAHRLMLLILSCICYILFILLLFYWYQHTLKVSVCNKWHSHFLVSFLEFYLAALRWHLYSYGLLVITVFLVFVQKIFCTIVGQAPLADPCFILAFRYLGAYQSAQVSDEAVMGILSLLHVQQVYVNTLLIVCYNKRVNNKFLIVSVDIYGNPAPLLKQLYMIQADGETYIFQVLIEIMFIGLVVMNTTRLVLPWDGVYCCDDRPQETFMIIVLDIQN